MSEYPTHPPSSDEELARLRALYTVVGQGISHDLRAPLRVIDGFTRQLEQTAGEQLDATSQQHLQRIRAASTRMGQLIDQIRELLRAENTPLHPQMVDITLLAEWSGAELCDLHPQSPCHVQVDEDLQAWGDERQYKVLFDQLLANAWQFSCQQDSPTIQVSGQANDGMLHLQIRDNGCGFEPRYAERAFEPFQRMHGQDQGAGAGLGLAIAHSIVHRSGGDIRIESQPDIGSTVHIRLPLQAPAAA